MTYRQEEMLTNLTTVDGMYQDLLQQCRSLEPEYERILRTLSPADRDILERYISLCEEMDHRKLCIAMTIKKDTLS